MRRSECPHSDICYRVNSIFYTLPSVGVGDSDLQKSPRSGQWFVNRIEPEQKERIARIGFNPLDRVSGL